MLIPFPTFESTLTILTEAAEELRLGRIGSAVDTLGRVRLKLTRVRGSARHRALALHVEDALGACSRGESECALYLLMHALSQFIPRKAA